ncbi:hydroxymethylglutaryl-CoA lyase [Pseudonocardia sp. KRD-184]|uniref:Hydroxymethylglutaryl-CoA lyase n=1 Tax=Pseudonocardia oceani TaxID=2792013 RepID=A0ABS6UCC5_9PSEU|nr:hydroxymethylglutaryl-CoA lyase [Pseudonocardia oceani]MBW0090366.1 hydroxymethylglutaryl-CoA lyase [Pseudonocardia oceani]MBW0097562.1 hydroxymethylglutaryl-CoA lyase [Pseudonocardia oceani]MBW0110057.1 hydroxymethylglutaryl-CoA lyase [Pseudonocardia oceani]MBW0124267.1 hydroxymethylglutaryl-CoA lyase [Pseudonocardia oceani]MBW0129524.1 hydroxymethylglutaryl-CoA lyase [Pseudonocardia oceani]
MAVAICEVGPRDGLQNEPDVLAPDIRAELANRMARTGVPRVEAASFVNPERVPQMAGAEEVLAAVTPGENLTRAALVLNDRGYERLRATSCEEVHVAFCVTETFNQRNQGRSVQESLQQARTIVTAAHEDGRRATVTLAASFGCPFEGQVDPARVLGLAEQLTDADEIVFADTIGVGVPSQVKKLLAGAEHLGTPLGLHLHNTRNTGYANAYAAVEAGVAVLDASVGGIGGCPFAPRATGNIATEDLLYMLDKEGVDTGVDIDEVIHVAEWLESILGRRLTGQLYRVGPFPPP